MKIELYYNNYTKTEYTKEEHPLAALYRLIGFKNNTSNHGYVVEKGQEFKNILSNQNRKGELGPFFNKDDYFLEILQQLEIPKKKNGKEKLLNYYPYIPELTLFGNLPREDADKSYNLGAYIKKVIEFGSKDKDQVKDVFDKIFQFLSVDHDPDNDEDVFCLLLSKEIKDWLDPSDRQLKWEKQVIDIYFNDWNTYGIDCPANTFVSDLYEIFKLKNTLSRFQWIKMLSGLLRLAMPMHLLWIYRNNIAMHLNLISLFNGNTLSNDQKTHTLNDYLFINEEIIEVRNVIANFKKSEMFIDLFIVHLSKSGFNNNNLIKITNQKELINFYDKLTALNLSKVPWKSSFFSEFRIKLSENSRSLSILKSKLKGRYWFIKHIMEQGSAEGLEHKKELDQYYWFKSRGNKTKLIPGAGQSLMLAYLSSHGKKYCTLSELNKHINKYGIRISNTNDNPIVESLRMMGLITDNPDSENGLSISNPLISK
jgi:hypothetical protein